MKNLQTDYSTPAMVILFCFVFSFFYFLYSLLPCLLCVVTHLLNSVYYS